MTARKCPTRRAATARSTRRWQADPEAFWAEAAREIDWLRPADTVFDPDAGIYGRWFVGARLQHLPQCRRPACRAGRGAQTAIVYDSPVTGTQRAITYAELRTRSRRSPPCCRTSASRRATASSSTCRWSRRRSSPCSPAPASARSTRSSSAALRPRNSRPASTTRAEGDPVRILRHRGRARRRLQAAPRRRDRPCRARSRRPASSCSGRKAEAALTAGRDLDWATAVGAAKAERPRPPACPSLATDPLYVLYTSGTTGRPKGVVRDNGGHMVALKWSMRNLYGIQPRRGLLGGSDVGWVVGHSYIVYGPLLHGCTSILYEGKPVGTPDAGAFWRVIAEHGVVTLFTAPTAFRAIKKEDPQASLIAGLRSVALPRPLPRRRAGRSATRCGGPSGILGVPVIDHWWQTETGWPIAGNPLGLGALPVKHGSPTVPMPGYGVHVLDEGGRRVPAGRHGLDRHQAAAAARLPSRPSGRRTTGSGRATSRPFRATTTPPTPASSTRTATSTSWAARTTSSTSPGTGSRPAAWRRCWPPIPPSPNARSSASRTRSRARCRAASWS